MAGGEAGTRAVAVLHFTRFISRFPVMIPALLPLFKADKFMFWGCMQGRMIFSSSAALCGDMVGWRIGAVERVSALHFLWKCSAEEPSNSRVFLVVVVQESGSALPRGDLRTGI